MKKESTKGLREGAMAVALTAILALLTRYMPLFATIGTFVCGVPLAVLMARNDFKIALPTLFVVFAVTVLINGSLISAASLVLMSCVPGGVAGYMLGKHKPFFVALFAAAFAVCIGWIFELLVLEAFMGSGIDEIIAEAMQQTKAMLSGVFDALGENAAAEMQVSPKQMLDIMVSTAESVMRLYIPAFIITSSMISGYIIIRISGFVIKRTRLASVEIIPFSHIKAPKSMSLIAILFYTCYIFAAEGTALFSVLANIVFVLYLILGVCGLSVVDFKLKARISSAFLRFVIYAAIFVFGGIFMSIISYILIFVGILDAGRDFRRIENRGA